jgi:hypothetical protein
LDLAVHFPSENEVLRPLILFPSELSFATTVIADCRPGPALPAYFFPNPAGFACKMA